MAVPALGQVIRSERALAPGNPSFGLLTLPAQDGNSALFFDCKSLVLMAPLPWAAGGVELSLQVDDRPPHLRRIPLGPLLALVERDEVALRESLRGGRLLTLKLQSPSQGVEFHFDLERDSLAAFEFAAQAAGTSREWAGSGLRHLQAVLVQTANGQNPSFAVLASWFGLALQDGEHRRTAIELVPDLLTVLHVHRYQPELDELGTAAFGTHAWKELRRLARYDGASYRSLNGPIDLQLDWMAMQCQGRAK
jgi:hypothetical protein